MRAQVLTEFGGPENFKLTDIPKPEVAVRVGRGEFALRFEPGPTVCRAAFRRPGAPWSTSCASGWCRATVVLYGEPVQYGTCAYWAFTMAGHRDLRLLDGGRRKWIQEKRPLSRTVPAFAPVEYPPPAPNA